MLECHSKTPQLSALWELSKPKKIVSTFQGELIPNETALGPGDKDSCLAGALIPKEAENKQDKHAKYKPVVCWKVNNTCYGEKYSREGQCASLGEGEIWYFSDSEQRWSLKVTEWPLIRPEKDERAHIVASILGTPPHSL